MNDLLTFHHIGIACRDIAKSSAFYQSMGYNVLPVIPDPLQHVKVCFMEKEGAPRVELLEPLDDKSPVLRILDAVGVSPYHTCFEVKNLQEAIAQLRQQRFMLVNGPVPACALENREIAFMFNKNYGLIELVEAFS